MNRFLRFIDNWPNISLYRLKSQSKNYTKREAIKAWLKKAERLGDEDNSSDVYLS